MAKIHHRTVRQVLMGSSSMRPASGWLYLTDSEDLSLDSPCIILQSAEDELLEQDSHGIPVLAIEQGFPRCVVESSTLSEIVSWTCQFADLPGAELLLEALVYYLDFDAFLPCPGATEPPSWEQTKLRLDREFFDALGAERPDVECRREGCRRGAISIGVLCRTHHFEMIHKRPYPFELDDGS